jgi:hypothetical protein
MVSGELHAPAALHPGKQTPLPIGQEAGWAPGQYGRYAEYRNVASSGNRTPAVHPVAIFE